MTEERRQLLVSLQAREETLKNTYANHITSLEDRHRRKIDILIKQHQSVGCDILHVHNIVTNRNSNSKIGM